jgi:hypothetical protein
MKSQNSKERSGGILNVKTACSNRKDAVDRVEKGKKKENTETETKQKEDL